MNQPWSFGIVYGNKPLFLNDIILSIKKQNIPEYEIILVGDSSVLPPLYDETNVKKVNFNENILPMWITKKKNVIAQVAQYENLSIHHDYVSLGDNWYQNFNNFGYDWDVAMTRIEQINGMRYRDWVRWDPLQYLDYKNNSETENMYVSGSYFCIKKQFFLNNPFDERITWGHGEDVEWSKRIRSFWKYKCNWKSKVKFCKAKECYPPDETDLSKDWYNKEINND